MAGRQGANGAKDAGNSKLRRPRVLITGGAVGAFLAAAAMATGSAAPAKADLDDLLDPIIQPILTQVTDSLAGVDPTLATDLTSWTDTFLADLNSLDSATSGSSTALAAAASPALSGGPPEGSIPITVAEDTEPTVQATVDGANTTLLVDTGSSGLVIPYTDLSFSQLLDLGFPSGINVSSYSGGVDYLYLEYNDVPTDYGNNVLDTTGPVDVEIYSYNPSDFSSFFTNDAFQNFDNDNEVTGILGIGDSSGAAGPTESPFEEEGDPGVTVDIFPNGQDGDLVVGPNVDAGANAITVSGAPTSTLYESYDGGPHTQVTDDVDSGGVYGTIPQSLVGSATTVPAGQTISVYDSSGDELYSYQTGYDSLGYSTSPDVVSGTSVDSGVEPYLEEPIYIDYGNDTLTFDDPLS